jgi:hypothetical protein
MDIDDSEGGRRAFWELTLSLRMHAEEDIHQMEPDTQESSKRSRNVSLLAGTVLPLRSLRIVELVSGREKPKGFVPGYAIVRIKSKYVVDEAESATMLPFMECKLSYDQLLDQYDTTDIESAASLDALAEKLLTVGKKIDREGLIMTDPKKSTAEFSSATGKLTVVSIRPKLVKTAKKQLDNEDENSEKLILPRPDSQLYMGANLQGYVAQVDPRFGAFVRFLDGLTGLVPKLKGGNDLQLFSTVVMRIAALDVTTTPMKILLSRTKSNKNGESDETFEKIDIKVGDIIQQAEVDDLDFHRARLNIFDGKWARTDKIRARVHCTMAESKSSGKEEEEISETGKQTITPVHPFAKWSVGMKLSNLTVVAVNCRAGVYFVELTNRSTDNSKEATEQPPSFFYADSSQLSPGQQVSGIVSSADQTRGGLWMQLSPGLSAFLPALELSLNPKVLNNLAQSFHVGSRLECTVVDRAAWAKTRSKLFGRTAESKVDEKKYDLPFLSLLQEENGISKSLRGDLVIGRINRLLPATHAPALMLNLRGGFVARCCITELEEVDEWVNMPLGRVSEKNTTFSGDFDEMDLDTPVNGVDTTGSNEMRYVLKSHFAEGLHEWNARLHLIDCEISLLTKKCRY